MKINKFVDLGKTENNIASASVGAGQNSVRQAIYFYNRSGARLPWTIEKGCFRQPFSIWRISLRLYDTIYADYPRLFTAIMVYLDHERMGTPVAQGIHHRELAVIDGAPLCFGVFGNLDRKFHGEIAGNIDTQVA